MHLFYMKCLRRVLGLSIKGSSKVSNAREKCSNLINLAESDREGECVCVCVWIRVL